MTPISQGAKLKSRVQAAPSSQSSSCTALYSWSPTRALTDGGMELRHQEPLLPGLRGAHQNVGPEATNPGRQAGSKAAQVRQGGASCCLPQVWAVSPPGACFDAAALAQPRARQ